MNEQHQMALMNQKLGKLSKPFHIEENVQIQIEDKWHKRYVIWKNDVLYFYKNSKNYNDTPLHVIWLTEDTRLSVDVSAKEKKTVVKFMFAEGGEVKLMAGKASKEFEKAFDKCKKEIREKLAQQKSVGDIFKMSEAKPVQNTQNKYLIPWNLLENKIRQRGKMNGKELTEFMQEIGEKSGIEHFYDIMKVATETWSDDEYIEFGYKQFCESDIYAFINMMAGQNKNGQTIYAFGDDVESVNKMMCIFLKLSDCEQWDFIEYVKYMLVCISVWNVKSDSETFRFIISYLLSTYGAVEVATIMKFIGDYESDIGMVEWKSFPDHFKLLLKDMNMRWENNQKNEFADILERCWGWNTNEIAQLRECLFEEIEEFY